MSRFFSALVMAISLVVSGLTFSALSAEASSVDFKCTFDGGYTDEGKTNEKMEFSFILDDVTGESIMRGNGGMSIVENHIGADAITFFEKLFTGAMQTTTITFSGNAVHSRHSLLLGDMVPSQYYGFCSIKKT